MHSTDRPAYRIEDATRPLWLGGTPPVWRDVLRPVDPAQTHDAASMIEGSGLGWTVEQCPLESRRCSTTTFPA